MNQLKPTPTAIWNPTATVNWSFLFTPAFGSLMQSYNWKSLGEKGKARTAKIWFVVSILLFILDPFFELLVAIPEDNPSPWHYRHFWYVAIWYFASGRSQTKYVKENFGKDYLRRAWGKPLMAATVVILLYAGYAWLVEEFFKQNF